MLAALVVLGANVERDDAVVPPSLEAELLARVLRYDRGLAGRDAGASLNVTIVFADSAPSEAYARQLATSLAEQPTLGGAPHRETLVRFTSVASLRAIELSEPRVIVLAPGLGAQAHAIVAAFEGRAVLTVSTTPAGVRDGLVLGFDLVDGKPRMLFNLTSSRRQRSDFRAEVIKLMTVVP